MELEGSIVILARVNFEYLEHPADIGLRARGESLEALFSCAARALVHLILEDDRIREAGEYRFTVEAADRESLLVNFLNEVLYLVDGKRLALGAFDVAVHGGTHAVCVARGEPRDESRHPGKLVVKAVTYHQLCVVRETDGFRADVFVDI